MAFSMRAERTGIEGLHGDELRLRSVHLRDLVERHQGAVVLDLDAVQHVHRGAAGAHGGHFLAEVLDRLVHAGLELGEQILERGIRGHAGLSHIVSE